MDTRNETSTVVTSGFFFRHVHIFSPRKNKKIKKIWLDYTVFFSSGNLLSLYQRGVGGRKNKINIPEEPTLSPWANKKEEEEGNG